jgi:hypothetical protein
MVTSPTSFPVVGVANSGPTTIVYPATTPVLDLLSVQPSAAWDLYKLKSTYAGAAVRVRRSNDNLEADIGFNANGKLDEVALMQHMVPNGDYAWDLGKTFANAQYLSDVVRLNNNDLLIFYSTISSTYLSARSTDNGFNWGSPSTVTPSGLAIRASSVVLPNSDILRAKADAVYVSVDNGLTWSLRANLPSSNSTYGGLTRLANGDLLATGTQTNAVYKSTNNGFNWAFLSSPTLTANNLAYIKVLSSGVVLATGSNKIFRSTDSGATWDAGTVLTGTGGSRITQLLSGRVIVSGPTKFWTSDDDGMTWSNTVSAPVTFQSGLVVELPNGDVLCTVEAQYGKLYRSSVFTDGFATQVYDQSGNGRTFSQATPAKQPSIVIDGTIQRQNGAPTLAFDGVDDEMSATVPSLFNTAPHTINLVTTVTVAASEVGLLNYAGNANAQAITANGSTVTSYFGGAGNTVSAPLILGKASVFTRTWDGSANLAKANLYVDQTAGATKAGTPANTSATTTITIGRSTTFSAQRFQGLIVFPSALGVTDRNVLELRQAEKHSVPD